VQWLYDELSHCLHREEVCDLVYKLEQKVKEMENKFGRIMYSNQIGLMFSWGRATIPNRRYISFEVPFLIIQIYI